MSWSRRAALAGLGGVAACGFAPAYGPGADGGGASRFRDAIRAQAPRDDAAFAFVARIEDRLGRAAVPRYGLAYGIATGVVGLAIDESDNIVRFNVEGTLDWTLREGDAVAASGRETAFVGYDAGESGISTVEARRDATRRLMTILADRVVSRLLAPA